MRGPQCEEVAAADLPAFALDAMILKRENAEKGTRTGWMQKRTEDRT
jgi:hypothetical protein